MGAHFPWLTGPSSADFWIATVCDDTSNAVAALVVKRCFGSSDTALIGLVCVLAKRRGQGLSHMLLSGAVREAQALGLTNLTLWTGQPAIYSRHGFESHDSALFGWVRNADLSLASCTATTQRTSWPDADERQARNRGLPPFAIDAYRLIDGQDLAQAIVVIDTTGPIVAEWKGDDTQVAQLLRAALPTTWRLNALPGDSLINALQSHGFQLDLRESRLQMWRTSADTLHTARPQLRLLDRI